MESQQVGAHGEVTPISAHEDVIVAMKALLRGDPEGAGLVVRDCKDPRGGMRDALVLAHVLIQAKQDPLGWLDQVHAIWEEAGLPQRSMSDTAWCREFLLRELDAHMWQRVDQLVHRARMQRDFDNPRTVSKTLQNAARQIGVERRGGPRVTEWRLPKASR